VSNFKKGGQLTEGNGSSPYKPNSLGPYKKGGQWLTKALFLETSYGETEYHLYTLKDQDDQDRGLKSLYLLYMAEEDLTEYDFAQKHLGGWEHWQELAQAPWFKRYLNRWRRELELKIKATALKGIINISNAGGKESLSALKFLVEKGWIERPEGKRGRPTKEEIKHELTNKELEEHLERINLQ
jgi:hypothetical protein